MLNSPRAPRLYYGWIITLALAVTTTVAWGILYYSFSVFLIPMEAELGVARAELSGAFSLALLVSGAAALPVGRWIDHHGARGLMTAGSLGAAALLWAWANVRGLPALYLVFAGLGLAMAAMLYDPAFAVLAAWFNRRRRGALTLLTLVAGLASTIFVPLANALLAAYGWRRAIEILAVLLLLLTGPLHVLVLRRRPHDLGLAPDGDPLSPPGAPGRPYLPDGHAPRAVVRRPSFWLLTVAYMLNGGVAVAAGVHFLAFLVGQGYPAEYAAVLAGLVGLMQLPGRLIFEPLARRIHRRWLSAGVIAVQGGAVLLLLGAPTPARLAAFVALFGMANGLLTLTRATVVAELYGAAHYGAISGLMSFWSTLARAAGPTVVALLYTATGGYAAAWLMLAAVTLVAVVAYLAADRPGVAELAEAGA
ncbi:MAG: MFS transporter [Anaerolineales bacterium]|nr:MFS transporter [Anaerolineales bacterium]